MMRAQKPFVILGVLVVVMVAVSVRVFRRPAPVPSSGRVKIADELAVLPVQEAVLTIAQPSRQREAQRHRAAQLAWTHDPFTHDSTLGKASGLTLSGILWDTNQPIAILNGQMITVGEEIQGYRIVDIQKETVSITDGHQTLQLKIAP